MKHLTSLSTVVTLANACELVNQVAQEVLGGDISDTVAGNVLTSNAVKQLALSQFQNQLHVHAGGV